ncbi:hypothetical protein ACJ73_07701 [Blastomyces percursus]|uniref:Uncharacterized protein n=1 Tax=Blastomyces percursus TaxID=1658174 RepID=A0A1J9QYN2_9EURO|nr:hypothetical protein ACJ73_07701 [Blastomyces percursus]
MPHFGETPWEWAVDPNCAVTEPAPFFPLLLDSFFDSFFDSSFAGDYVSDGDRSQLQKSLRYVRERAEVTSGFPEHVRAAYAMSVIIQKPAQRNAAYQP